MAQNPNRDSGRLRSCFHKAKILKSLAFCTYLGLFWGLLSPSLAVSQTQTAVQQNPLPFDWVRVQVLQSGSFINGIGEATPVDPAEQILIPTNAAVARNRNLVELVQSSYRRGPYGHRVYRNGVGGSMDLESLVREGRLRILDSSAQMAVPSVAASTEAGVTTTRCDGTCEASPNRRASAVTPLVQAAQRIQASIPSPPGPKPQSPRVSRSSGSVWWANVIQEGNCESRFPNRQSLEYKTCLYSRSQQVRRMMDRADTTLDPRWAKKYPRTPTSAFLYTCYRGVKFRLKDAGLVPGYLNGDARPMSSAPASLRANGFINIMGSSLIKKPDDAPPGAVLVYSDEKDFTHRGSAPYGHIEIRTYDGYVSDFKSPTALTKDQMSRSRTATGTRRLIGIYIKDMTAT